MLWPAGSSPSSSTPRSSSTSARPSRSRPPTSPWCSTSPPARPSDPAACAPSRRRPARSSGSQCCDPWPKPSKRGASPRTASAPAGAEAPPAPAPLHGRGGHGDRQGRGRGYACQTCPAVEVPRSPMSNASDDANDAELLDDDKLPPAYPPDEPLGVDEYGVTAAEEAVEEPLAERVAREEPELVPRNGDRAYGDPVGTLVAPESAVDELDVTAEEVAREVTAAEPPALDDGDLAF